MLVFLASCVVVLAVLGLGLYAVRAMRPGSFRLRTTLLRVFSLSLEIEAPSNPPDTTKDQLDMAATAGAEGRDRRLRSSRMTSDVPGEPVDESLQRAPPDVSVCPTQPIGL